MLFNEIAVVFFLPFAFALTVQKQRNGGNENEGKQGILVFCW